MYKQKCNIYFRPTHPDAKLPQRKNKESLKGDSGYDVYAVKDAVIPANSTEKVEVGLQFTGITEGYWIRVESRSGLFFKNKITVFNGILDNPFRGELGIALINNGTTDYEVKAGDRVAQLVVYELLEPEIAWREEIDETNRGDKGLGSSGR